MKKTQKTAQKMLTNIADKMVKKDAREWPPECMVFMYQPIRPQRKTDESASNQSEQR